MRRQHRIGTPTAEAVDEIWQRRATAAAIAAVRQVIDGGAIPKGTPIGRLIDLELGWLTAAALFAWIRTRAEQATAEGWDTEQALRLTGLDPEPWDSGSVVNILPKLAELEGIDWERPVGAWPKDTVIRFLLAAMKLVRSAMIARDVGGGGITSNRKPVMQRVASAEAGGPLVAPGPR
jgi:hypothetical protein